MKRMMFLACAGMTLGTTAALSASAGSNQDGLERTNLAPQYKLPVRVARIIGRDANGMPIPGPWMPYKDSGQDGTTLQEVYDHYEGSTFCGGAIPFPPVDGAAFGGFDPSCGSTTCLEGQGRWWLGGTFRGCSYLSHVESIASGMAPVANNITADWTEHLNSGNPDACGDNIDRLVIAVLTYDSTVGALMDGTSPITAQNLEDGFLDGVLLDFGAQGGTGPGPWRYVTNVDLTGGDPELPVEIEVGGACETNFIDASLDGEDLILNRYSVNNQAILWHSKDVAGQGSTNGNTGLDGDVIASFCSNADAGDGEYADTEVGTEVETPDCPATVVAAVGLYGEPEQGGPICPEAFQRVRGLPVSGNLASLCEGDDDYLITRPDVFRTVAIPPVQVQIDFTSTDNPAQLEVVIESAANVTNIFQRINLFNFDTNLYESVDTSVLATTDGTRTVTISTNAGRFVQDGTGRVRVLTQCNALAFSIAPIWQYRIDVSTVEK